MTDPTKIPDEVVERLRRALPLGCAAYLTNENVRAALAAAGFAELREDAERYRYLKTAGDSDLCVRGEEDNSGRYGMTNFRDMIYGAELDAAIDAARKGE